MMNHLLLFAYEYPGYHSKSGAALARRVKQVAESFAAQGWQVTVVHKDQTGENGNEISIAKKESDNITRISVRSHKAEFSVFERSAVRRLFTLYYLLRRGDRTYHWANTVKENLLKHQLSRPDLIVSFFTPRGPLFLGNYFAKKFNSPWIADLQDELDQGTVSSNAYFTALNSHLSHVWVRKVLRTAKAVVQVSPEWAKTDSAIAGKAIACVRHAITDVPDASVLYNQDINSEFRIFYGGSLELEHQELGTLNTVLKNVRTDRPVKLVIAGTEKTYAAFRNTIDGTIEISYAGWLNTEAYNEQIRRSHCCLIVPWSGQNRQAIPSKFYEVCTLRPVWIAGKDSGAFTSLMNDLQHTAGNYGDAGYGIKALKKAVTGDYSMMFTLDKCGVQAVTDKQLCDHYLQLLK